MDRELEEAREAFRDRTSVQPPAVLAGLVEGGRETSVSVSLSDGPPDALQVRRAAVQRQQLPGEACRMSSRMGRMSRRVPCAMAQVTTERQFRQCPSSVLGSLAMGMT